MWQYEFGLTIVLHGEEEGERLIQARAPSREEQLQWLQLGKSLLAAIARAAFRHIMTAPKKWEKAELQILGPGSQMLSQNEMKQIVTTLPMGMQDKSWRRVYTLDDGAWRIGRVYVQADACFPKELRGPRRCLARQPGCFVRRCDS
jgi:hypothetical protein